MLFKTRKSIQERVDAVPFWWHSIPVGRGVVTPGGKSLANLEAEREALRFPSLRGKTFLDVGAWDGYFSFVAEDRGAKRVVALDHYVWSLDPVAQRRYFHACRERGETPALYETVPGLWQPDTLPGRRGFETARELLGSRVEAVVGDLLEIDLEALGVFDVVLYKGVLYHMEDPLRALRRLAQVTGEVAIVETAAVAVPGFESQPLCQFFESDELNFDPTNWWAPNLFALGGLLRAAGFSRVETVVGPPAELEPGRLHPYRAIVHAFR